MRNLEVQLVFYRTLYSQSAASLTMGTLAAFLDQAGISNRLVLLEHEALHGAEKILARRGKANIVIAKPNFKDYALMLPLLAELRRQGAVDRVFLCGPFASLNYASLMRKQPWLDGIIVGQAEETAVELLRCLGRNKPFDRVAGGVWRDVATGRTTPYAARDYRLKLNDLPPARRDIERGEAGTYINIEASRGCSGQCSFCHIPLVSRLCGVTGIDLREPTTVVDEMERLYKELGKTLFIFNDSCFWRGPQDDARILEFCAQLRRRRLPIQFYVYLKCLPPLPDELLGELAAAGLARVFLGVENVSAHSQKVFNKRIEASAYESAKARYDRFHINLHIGYIVFEPYATPEDIRRNFLYLRHIGKLFRIGVLVEAVRVIPGSGFHRQLLQDGLLDEGLAYDRLTYGYRFKHPATERLLGAVRQVFLADLKEKAYGFEYYCTTLGLLRDMCQQSDKRLYRALADDFADFARLEDAAMDEVLGFLLRLTTAAKREGSDETLEKLSRKFAADFDRHYYALQTKHADIFCQVRARGGDALAERIYRGLDRITE